MRAKNYLRLTFLVIVILVAEVHSFRASSFERASRVGLQIATPPDLQIRLSRRGSPSRSGKDPSRPPRRLIVKVVTEKPPSPASSGGSTSPSRASQRRQDLSPARNQRAPQGNPQGRQRSRSPTSHQRMQPQRDPRGSPKASQSPRARSRLDRSTSPRPGRTSPPNSHEQQAAQGNALPPSSASNHGGETGVIDMFHEWQRSDSPE